MTEVDEQLRKAELGAEMMSAVFRIVVFLILAVAIGLSADGEVSPDFAEAAVALYGAGAVVGLLLAWRGIHHPAVAYAFVTFDVVLVAAQVLALGRLMGMPMGSVLAMPATSLIFVILIHASMRYQPVLVLYAAVVFIASVQAGEAMLSRAFGTPSTMGHMTGASAMAHEGMSGVWNYEVLPPMLILLAAALLFVVGRRTRGLLFSSVRHASRMARLARFFSPNLAMQLAETDMSDALAGRRQQAAVLFVDIRGFTSLGEAMTPEELGAFLSEYRSRLAQPVFAHGGMIDKFIGDAIMAVFGVPNARADDASRALACGVDILAEAERWSQQRTVAGKPPVKIGIGGHFGEVFAGALGNDQLLEYTIIGDTVNVAERLERLSREVESPLVVSLDLLKSAGGNQEDAGWRHLPTQMLRGHKTPVDAVCLASDRLPHELTHHDPNRLHNSRA